MISSLLINSIFAGAVAGSLCGGVGAICARMKLSTIAFTMAHAALAGSAMSFIFKVDPIVLGGLLAILTSFFVGPLSDYLRIPLDIASMTLFSVYNALTFISLVIAPGPALAMEKVGQLFWGSVLAVTTTYLVILFTLAIIYGLFLHVFWGRISSILFDVRLAEAEGVEVRRYGYFLTALAGIIIVFTLRITGGFLVFSLLFIPSASSLQISENLRGQVLTSSLIGAAASVLGVLLSLGLNLPVGSCIVIGAAAIFISIALASALLRRKIINAVNSESR